MSNRSKLMPKKKAKPIVRRLLEAIANSEADGTQYVYLTRKDATDAVKRIVDLRAAAVR